MNISIQKVHGSENDFFILNKNELDFFLTDEMIDQLRRQLCDRKHGLLGGADGLLIVENATSNDALAKMRVINSDGSEASMCGNGLRTVARYLAEKTGKKSFIVETMFAKLKVQQANELGFGISTYQVEISPVHFETSALPMNSLSDKIVNQLIPELSSSIKFSTVAVPNPHLIAFVEHDLIGSQEFERIATYVNSDHSLFPDGINVSFVEILDKNELFVRTFERGVGFTNACGTAMCASSLIYVLLSNQPCDELITVRNPGGLVKTLVHKNDQNKYWMELIGNATITHYISGTLSDYSNADFTNLTITETNEQQMYLNFLSTYNS